MRKCWTHNSRVNQTVVPVGGGGACRAIHGDTAPLVWRAPEGTGGIRRGARLRRPWAMAGPGRASRRRAEPHISDPTPLVWRAPEGPEGQGGLRGAAPNKVRPPSLAGGRALQRPEHQRGHKQR